jgi:hypothetical protein
LKNWVLGLLIVPLGVAGARLGGGVPADDILAARVGTMAMTHDNRATAFAPSPSPSRSRSPWGGRAEGGRVEGGGEMQFPYQPYDGRFIFARIFYEAGRGRGFGRFRGNDPGWYHDYPYAEQNLTTILRELSYLWPYTEGGNILALDDERLFQFPIAYMSEPGDWNVSQSEAESLRSYLLKGGFIIFDDFGGRDMYNLAEQMAQVFPDLQWIPLDSTDALFDSFFQIDPGNLQLPSYRGVHPEFYGLFEDNDKTKQMYAVAANNSDFGEFWEAQERGFYIVDLQNEAYKVGVNYIIYAYTH